LPYVESDTISSIQHCNSGYISSIALRPPPFFLTLSSVGSDVSSSRFPRITISLLQPLTSHTYFTPPHPSVFAQLPKNNRFCFSLRYGNTDFMCSSILLCLLLSFSLHLLYHFSTKLVPTFTVRKRKNPINPHKIGLLG